MSGRLTLLQKLMSAAALFLVPIALLGQLFYAASMSNISTARKELQGVSTLRAVWPVLVAASEGGPALAEKRDRLLAQIAAASTANAADLGIEQLQAELIDAINKANPSDAPLAVRSSASSLIQKVADASGLTLDPDLDTYYTQDALTTKLPAMFTASANTAECRAGRAGTRR